MRPRILGLIVSLLFLSVSALPTGGRREQPLRQLPYELDIGPSELPLDHFDEIDDLSSSLRYSLREAYPAIYKKWFNQLADAYPEAAPPDEVRGEASRGIQAELQTEIETAQGHARRFAVAIKKEIEVKERALKTLKEMECKTEIEAERRDKKVKVVERRLRSLKKELAGLKGKPKASERGQVSNSNVRNELIVDHPSLVQHATNFIADRGKAIAQAPNHLVQTLTRISGEVAKVNGDGVGRHGHGVGFPAASPRLGLLRGF